MSVLRSVLVCSFLVLLLVQLGGCASANRPLQLVSGQGPAYPAGARANGVEGSVTVRYDVTVDGAVKNARVVASEPQGVFDEAALLALRSWRFNAPVLNGERQATRNRESTLTFRLGGTDEYDSY